jgi:branched-subunit amino acid transport protein
MTSAEQVWLLMATAGIGTFAIRYSFVGLVSKSEVPRWATNLLRHVPAAALTALVVSSMGSHGAENTTGDGELRLYAALIAGLVAWRTKSMTATIISGMAGLWALKYIFT